MGYFKQRWIMPAFGMAIILFHTLSTYHWLLGKLSCLPNLYVSRAIIIIAFAVGLTFRRKKSKNNVLQKEKVNEIEKMERKSK